ncbi:MAG: hypothetical protein PHY09_01825 [Desulfuromonadaceae bacterium]|nr:hypothetical protein [Desulfuromonadaceae bacterium]MDD5105143.1 hypothetical protein [Desulfuromonadaceae bacterium]
MNVPIRNARLECQPISADVWLLLIPFTLLLSRDKTLCIPSGNA